jgi:2-keto-4-pentenoate hydratase/2-oxohepta-3-ene-1,7-dioic acid hydratase in catechol pathway
MRLCRFDDNRLGVVDGALVTDVSAALDVLPVQRYPFPTHDVLVEHLDRVLERARALAPSAPKRPVDDVTLLSPVANPGKLVGAPVNYEKHRTEVQDDATLHHGNPGHMLAIRSAGLFLKATGSLVGPGEGIALRRADRRTDHEVELAVVIGRRVSRVRWSDALACVAGYAIGLDISIRGSEDRSFRKSADSYSVLGPWLVTADEVPDPGSLDLQLSVNGELRQHSNTKYMILSVAELVEMASSMYTLYPGDVLFTGTPEGVSPIQAGDRIEAAIEGIGSMAVVARADAGASMPAMSA